MIDKRKRQRYIYRCLRLSRQPYSRGKITEPSRQLAMRNVFAALILFAMFIPLVTYHYISHP